MKADESNLITTYVSKSLKVIQNEGVGALFRKIWWVIRAVPLKYQYVFTRFLPGDSRGLPSAENANKYDVIFFPIIDWNFRYQRPQHLASRFAKNGHRVFYISAHLKRQKTYSVKKISRNIYEIILPFHTGCAIYQANMEMQGARPLSALKRLYTDFAIRESAALVEFPLWQPLVRALKNDLGTCVIFDCLDEYSGFENVGADIREFEKRLVLISDFCFATSARLYDKLKTQSTRVSVVRNATEFDHFHRLPANDLLKHVPRPIIGYYGAISEWFDSDIVEHIAVSRPDWSIVLIGRRAGSDVERLKKYANVHMLWEKSYEELPRYLYWFDVCMIPFKMTGLILSTNPVKFYEYISSGKPVVANPFPELLQYREVFYPAAGKDDFLINIERALRETDETVVARRIRVARENDWDGRFHDVRKSISACYPLVSIIIVTYNNVALTRLCIESIYAKTAYPRFEVIIVDNASSDGTREYLTALKDRHPSLRTIFNSDNLGFAVANNMGIKESKGEYVVYLNNDTVVTRGWIHGLIQYLKDPEIGMVGPVTNSIGNEAKIVVGYKDIADMDRFAERHVRKNKGKSFEISVLALFCAALRRHTLEAVGPLDERFSVGMFEDDDYAVRVKNAGLKIICAEDVFIHHYHGAAFKKIRSDEYMRIFEENRVKFEQKWGIVWKPHVYKT